MADRGYSSSLTTKYRPVAIALWPSSWLVADNAAKTSPRMWKVLARSPLLAVDAPTDRQEETETSQAIRVSGLEDILRLKYYANLYALVTSTRYFFASNSPPSSILECSLFHPLVHRSWSRCRCLDILPDTTASRSCHSNLHPNQQIFHHRLQVRIKQCRWLG